MTECIQMQVPTNRLRELREAAKLSQEALGALMGVSKMQISKLERDKGGFSISHLRKAASCLKCYPSDILVEADRRPDSAALGKVDQQLLKMIMVEVFQWREGVGDFIEKHGHTMGPEQLARAIAQAYNRLSSQRNSKSDEIEREVDTLLAFLAEG